MTQDQTNKTVLITGSSSGIGFLATLKYARAGYITYASTRNLDSESVKELESISKRENISIKPIYLDLLDDDSIKQCVEKIILESGRIDVLLNNAGSGYYSAVEDIDPKVFSRLLETNVIGTIKTVRAVLPQMRKQKSGLIINISSILGFSTAPLNGPYSASKYALEALSETLALEVKPFGINVVIVQPGGFNTSFVKNAVHQDYSQESPYLKLYSRKDNKMKDAGDRGGDPSKVANLLLKISETKNPKLRYMIGKQVKLRKILHILLLDSLWIKFLRIFYKW